MLSCRVLLMPGPEVRRTHVSLHLYFTDGPCGGIEYPECHWLRPKCVYCPECIPVPERASPG